jgi:hypothetical protein
MLCETCTDCLSSMDSREVESRFTPTHIPHHLTSASLRESASTGRRICSVLQEYIEANGTLSGYLFEPDIYGPSTSLYLHSSPKDRFCLLEFEIHCGHTTLKVPFHLTQDNGTLKIVTPKP